MAQKAGRGRAASAPKQRRGSARLDLALKRVYEPSSPDDGARVLVDRLWPRGLSREKAAVDLWLKDAAPSDALRRWYGHEPERWQAFAARYREELARNADALHPLDELRARGRVTLLYAARDPERNNAAVLRGFLEARR